MSSSPAPTLLPWDQYLYRISWKNAACPFLNDVLNSFKGFLKALLRKRVSFVVPSGKEGSAPGVAADPFQLNADVTLWHVANLVDHVTHPAVVAQQGLKAERAADLEKSRVKDGFGFKIIDANRYPATQWNSTLGFSKPLWGEEGLVNCFEFT